MSLLKPLFPIHDRPEHEHDPIAIGAVGGSGTRMIAQLLRDAGYYIGSDLNEANDNLWAELLFNRRSIVVEPRADFERLAGVFFARMRGTLLVDDDVSALVRGLSQRPTQYSVEWLEKRADRFLSEKTTTARRLWAWKIPHTHVIIERLLECHSGLRYIHVVRHGLDMALSSNQNQLKLWGSVFLSREVDVTPADSLAYWCAVQRRVNVIAASYPGRVLTVDFDRFCRDPHAVSEEILNFCGRTLSTRALNAFAAKVVVPESAGRFRNVGAVGFADADLRYVESLGYAVG